MGKPQADFYESLWRKFFMNLCGGNPLRIFVVEILYESLWWKSFMNICEGNVLITIFEG